MESSLDRMARSMMAKMLKKAPKPRVPSVAMQLTTFSLFPSLPLDIRLIIWKVVCFHQRNVDISIKHVGATLQDINPPSYGMNDFDYLITYRSRCCAPSILHVNHESRVEGLKYYSLDFGVVKSTKDYNFVSSPSIYLNWKVDRLCIMETDGWDHLQDLNQRLLDNSPKFLAINYSYRNDFYNRFHNGFPNGRILHHIVFPAGLVEVTLFNSILPVSITGGVDFKEVRFSREVLQLLGHRALDHVTNARAAVLRQTQSDEGQEGTTEVKVMDLWVNGVPASYPPYSAVY